MADFILGIDAGGTAVKAAIYSLDGQELGPTVRNCRPLTPAPGHVERDPLQLWKDVAATVRTALAGAGLTGADIASAALGAAFLARAENSRITTMHVLHAARREMAKHGKALRWGDWEN